MALKKKKDKSAPTSLFGRLRQFMRDWERRRWARNGAKKVRAFDHGGDLQKLLGFACNAIRRPKLRPMQKHSEILEVLTRIQTLKPRRMLEIGTANGGTLFMFTRLCAPDALIISLDLPKGRYGGGYPEWKIPFYQAFPTASQKLELIRANSHAPESLAQVKAILNGEPLDYLYIDGDHTYEGVKQDFEMYSPLVRQGGLVIFHDICPVPPEPGCDVRRLWLELRAQYPHEEFLESETQRGAGLGVLKF